MPGPSPFWDYFSCKQGKGFGVGMISSDFRKDSSDVVVHACHATVQEDEAAGCSKSIQINYLDFLKSPSQTQTNKHCVYVYV